MAQQTTYPNPKPTGDTRLAASGHGGCSHGRGLSPALSRQGFLNPDLTRTGSKWTQQLRASAARLPGSPDSLGWGHHAHLRLLT